MSRTQKKLQAMSAQELLIQEKKRMIEEKMRLNNSKKFATEFTATQYSDNSNNSNKIPSDCSHFPNDSSYPQQFHNSQGHLPMTTPYPTTNQHMHNAKQASFHELENSSMNPSQQLGSTWFPSTSQAPPFFDQTKSSTFPLPSLPFNPCQMPPLFPPAPFLPPPPPPPPIPASFPLPPSEFLSKMLQAPPPPLPVPPPTTNSSSTSNTNNNIKNEDLYDPLMAEEEEEEEEEEKQNEKDNTEERTTPDSKPVNRTTFQIKKEIAIKIEPSQSTSRINNQREDQKPDNGGNRRRQVATTSTDLSSTSALWWNFDDDNEDDNKEKPISTSQLSNNDQYSQENTRKRKSRWGLTSSIKQEPTDHKFVQQIHEATEKAKSFVAQLNEQMKLYPEGYDGTKMNDQQRKQYIEQKELQAIYQNMMVKRRELENFAREQQKTHEYDSDEETDNNGTWEHRLRTAEMDITREWAVKLTEMAHGKHHIGDFIPPHELEKFMKTYSALKEGETPDVSDYRDFKIQAENVGYRLLEKFGWKEGQGLGKNSQGIVNPINKGPAPVNNSGLGQTRPSELDRNDDEYQMYRKRMMLAYRFRPNPLNNPRRDYY